MNWKEIKKESPKAHSCFLKWNNELTEADKKLLLANLLRTWDSMPDSIKEKFTIRRFEKLIMKYDNDAELGSELRKRFWRGEL